MIVADKVADGVIAFLLANKKPDKFQVIAVKTPEYGQEARAGALTDLAVLTGGRPFIRAAGHTFNRLSWLIWDGLAGYGPTRAPLASSAVKAIPVSCANILPHCAAPLKVLRI